ncbi:hypothetical protein FACS1894202_08550 [Clostridia bacterium]|nr:hypothetical protein FACS1894202_08550 [Clostridia bacterium]
MLYQPLSMTGTDLFLFTVTPEGWLHIRLDTLLPSIRYKSTAYISDAIIALLGDLNGNAGVPP